MLSQACPGVKKRDLLNLGAFTLQPLDNGKCIVTRIGQDAQHGPQRGGKAQGWQDRGRGGKGKGRQDRCKGGGAGAMSGQGKGAETGKGKKNPRSHGPNGAAGTHDAAAAAYEQHQAQMALQQQLYWMQQQQPPSPPSVPRRGDDSVTIQFDRRHFRLQGACERKPSGVSDSESFAESSMLIEVPDEHYV